MQRDEIVQWIKQNRRLMVMVGVGGCLAIMLLLWGESSPAVQPAAQLNVVSSGNETVPDNLSSPVMPKGYQGEVAVRDPFARERVPVSSGVPPAAALPASSPQGVPKPAPPAKPVLAGVASGGGRYVAIVSLRGESRALKLGEKIGEYQLVRVTGNSATLQGPSGTVLLQRKGE